MSATRLSNYRRSNAITAVELSPSPAAKALVHSLLKETSADLRQKLSQELLDELCLLTAIEPVRVKISATRQYHKVSEGKMVFKQYGYYRGQSRYIYIQNQTPILGQDVAPRTFLDTLLHEWMHHYDQYKLKLDSIHTSGFYTRLRKVKEILGMWEEEGGGS
jgi:hypothetical protein